MTKSFSATVDAWARATEQRIQAVHRRSVELLAEEMRNTKPNGGRVPFMTGNLSRSLLASTQGLPKTSKGPFTGQDVGIVTATMKIDQPIWIGYQAEYARRVNYGFIGADKLGRVYNQAGSYFVEGAIANWQQIVTKAIAEAKAAVRGAG